MVGGRVHQRLRIRGHFQRGVVTRPAPLPHQILRLSERMGWHGGDLRRESARLVHELIGLHHPADEAPVQRGRSIDHVAGIEQLRRPRLADDARQDPGAAIARNDTELQEGDAEFRAFAGDADIGEAGEIAAQSDRRAVDRRDQWHTQIVERAQHLVDVVPISVRDLGSRAAEIAGLLLHRLDVAARAERPPRPGKDHAAHV